MKKLLLTAILAAAVSSAFGQTITFNDNVGVANAGTYNPTDVFNVDVFLNVTSNSSGFSYWLQTESGIASQITLTAQQYFTFDTNTQPGAKTFSDTAGADPGFLSAKGAGTLSGDLGGTNAGAVTIAASATPYKVSNLTFSLSGLAPGTYHLYTTTLSPKASEATYPGFVDNPITQAVYTFTVVPEPATWSLFGLGGVGSLGLTWLRARRRS